MIRKKISWLWISTASLALLSVGVLGTGFGMALLGPKGEVAKEPPVVQVEAQEAAAVAAQGQPLSLVALGDSLTKGVGDTSGKGYVGALKEKLEAAGQTVQVQNLGISGLESTELVNSLQNKGTQEALKSAKLITISIGGNDVTHSIGGVGKILSTSKLDEALVNQTQEKYTKNMEQILKEVRTHNPDAPVLLVGLYNPFEGVFEDQPLIHALLGQWNANLVKTAQAYPNVKVIPTYDIFQWNVAKLLSVDHFHPNDAGYEKMAERMMQAIPDRIQVKQ